LKGDSSQVSSTALQRGASACKENRQVGFRGLDHLSPLVVAGPRRPDPGDRGDHDSWLEPPASRLPCGSLRPWAALFRDIAAGDGSRLFAQRGPRDDGLKPGAMLVAGEQGVSRNFTTAAVAGAGILL